MQGRSVEESAALVGACTAAAVHRRDHHHDEAACHPHVVEVVHLGRRAVVVCHDCGADSGFLPEREAEDLATSHRAETLGDASPTLRPAA